MSELKRTLVVMIATAALAISTQAQDAYRVGPPPPPEIEMEAPSPDANSSDKTTPDATSAKHHTAQKVVTITGQVANLLTEGVKPKDLSVVAGYDQTALEVISLLNTGRRTSFALAPGAKSPEIPFVQIRVLEGAEVGKVYVVLITIHDKQNRYSNTAKVEVRITPPSTGGGLQAKAK